MKHETIQRDFLQKWKVECRADGLVAMRFAIFPLHLSKVLRLATKKWCQVDEVLHLSRKIISANLKIWCSNMQPFSGHQRPDLLTALMNMSLVLRLPRKMHLCRSSSNVPCPPSFLEMLQKPHVFAHFWQGAQSLAPATQNDASTSKSGASMCGALHIFDFEMCFAPQRRTLFRHLIFKKWSEPVSFYTIDFEMCFAPQLRTLSTSQLPNVVRTCGVLYILTWKCASRHNGVQFFISHLASWPPAPARFSEPTFRPSGATNHGKNRVFRDFPTFSRTWTFFLLALSLPLLFSSFLWLFPSLLFHLSILSEVWLPNFLR